MSHRLIAYIVVIVITVLSTLFLQSYRHFRESLSEFSYSRFGSDLAGRERSITISEGGERAELLPKIQKIFYENRIVNLGRSRKSDFVVLDGETETFVFRFGPHTVSISSDHKLPERFYVARKQILDLIDIDDEVEAE